MSEERSFHIGDVLSAYTGILLSPTGMDGIYSILNFLHRDNLFTHQLPRASRDARGHLEKSLPWITGLDCKEVTTDNWKERLKTYEGRYGTTHLLTPIPHAEELHRDPIAEAEEMVPGKVIVVGHEPQS